MAGSNVTQDGGGPPVVEEMLDIPRVPKPRRGVVLADVDVVLGCGLLVLACGERWTGEDVIWALKGAGEGS